MTIDLMTLFNDPIFQSLLLNICAEGLYDFGKAIAERIVNSLRSHKEMFGSEKVQSVEQTWKNAIENSKKENPTLDKFLWDDLSQFLFDGEKKDMKTLSGEELNYIADRIFLGKAVYACLDELKYENLQYRYSVMLGQDPYYFDVKGLCSSYQCRNYFLGRIIEKKPEPIIHLNFLVETIKENPEETRALNFMPGDVIFFVPVSNLSSDFRKTIGKALSDCNSRSKGVPYYMFVDKEDFDIVLNLDVTSRVKFFIRRLEEIRQTRR